MHSIGESLRRQTDLGSGYLFISYCSKDKDRVTRIVESLEEAGLRLWIDLDGIPGGANYGSEIVRAIQHSRAVIVMCSDAAMRSRNVKQEIQIAWRYGRPYVPMLLEPVTIQAQLAYWLEGWQWVEVLDLPPERWIPRVLTSLQAIFGADPASEPTSEATEKGGEQCAQLGTAESLWTAARFTDRIWPVPADLIRQTGSRLSARGLGAHQPNVSRTFRLGSRICVAIKSDTAGHLLLLDKGPEQIVYCLCPSFFVPETQFSAGLFYLPREAQEYDAFVVTGRPGREHLLALVTNEPLDLLWMSDDPSAPAKILGASDLDDLVSILRVADPDEWTALSTYFDVIA
jgi:hypothetical protein